VILNNEKLYYSERKEVVHDKQKLNYAGEGCESIEELVLAQRRELVFD
jgi:hypothetical protein